MKKWIIIIFLLYVKNERNNLLSNKQRNNTKLSQKI